jgi:DNA-binding transcriptional regulator GbsR (MarR family)
LAARIYILLLLSDRSGLSFDEVRDFMDASKSSISANINLLLQGERINFLTKPGDRKRYFKPSPRFLNIRLEESLGLLKKETEIVNQIMTFNTENNINGFEEVQTKLEKYAEHLQEVQEKYIKSLDYFHENN